MAGASASRATIIRRALGAALEVDASQGARPMVHRHHTADRRNERDALAARSGFCRFSHLRLTRATAIA
jgi:hypothetical protein